MNLYFLNHKSDTFSFAGRIKSISNAFVGITEMLKGQHNTWIHTLATVCVIAAGFFYQLKTTEWCFLVLVIILVWVSEAINTAFEFLCDVASPEFHPLVKKSKDVAAGAVLLNAIGSIIVGLIIFLPYISA